MKFRLRSMFYLITVVAVVCYLVTAPPCVYMRDPGVLLSQNMDQDVVGCKLVNRGFFPVYIRSFVSYSNEMSVFRPRRIHEANFSKDEWLLDFEFGFGPTLKQPELKQMLWGDVLLMSKGFSSNNSDRRVKIHFEMTDWLGRSYRLQSEEMKYDASGAVEGMERLESKPLATTRGSQNLGF